MSIALVEELVGSSKKHKITAPGCRLDLFPFISQQFFFVNPKWKTL